MNCLTIKLIENYNFPHSNFSSRMYIQKKKIAMRKTNNRNTNRHIDNLLMLYINILNNKEIANSKVKKKSQHAQVRTTRNKLMFKLK